MQKQYHNLLICLFNLLLLSMNYVDCFIGINWGRQASENLVPSMVIDLILQNGIPEVKIVGTTDYILTSFARTNLGLVVALRDVEVRTIRKPEDAEIWITTRLLIVDIDKGINIRYICLGTEPYTKDGYETGEIEAGGAVVVENMQGKIDKIYPGKGIKVTMEHDSSVMIKVKEPSKADFEPELKEGIKGSTASLSRFGSPIFLSMHPMKYAKSIFNDIEFGYFENNSTSQFTDIGGYKYTNIFEVMYDQFVCALEKVGFDDIKVIVGKVGWPTDGADGACPENAARFHQGLIKHILSGKGTPRHPGPIDVYIENLTDENMLPVVEEGAAVRHWGIYEFDGTPKYHIDFSGKGQSILPVTATGVTHLPKRWCVFNEKTNDMELIRRYTEMACSVADCTNMDPGGSCEGLMYPDNISYAFNAFFQFTTQKIEKGGCDFGGLGSMTTDDPSYEICKFQVNIISPETTDDTKEKQGNVVENQDTVVVENQGDLVVVENQGNMIMITRTYIVVRISILLMFMTFLI